MQKNHEEKSIFLRLETALPTDASGVLQRFCVNRKLKAKWNDDPAMVVESIAAEINAYKGSFVGDMVMSLNSMVKKEIGSAETNRRELDVARWTASLLETSLYDCLAQGDYDGSSAHDRVQTSDGDTRSIQPVTQHELANVDIEKVVLLLTPKLQHLCYLISKRIKNENDDNI
jgi:hypothetical protein